MALPVDTSQSDALNLQVLQRQDDQIMDILGTASHVVVYEFDQGEQSWKRKDVEGSLFVVKRYSNPRFQIFVSNRLNLNNLTISIDAQMNVDNVDDFLIIRCVNPAAPSTYTVYGIWFFPVEDRHKTLKLLERVITSIKGSNGKQPEAEASPAPAPAQATAAAAAKSTHGPIGSPRKGTVLSKAEGAAAGVAILGMISQGQNEDANLAQATDAQLNISTTNLQPAQAQPSQRQKKQRDRTPPHKKELSKEQFKEALIECLNEPAFLDQIFQAYQAKQTKRS